MNETLAASPQALSLFADRALLLLPDLLAALAILVAGFVLAGWLGRLLANAFARSTRVDATIRAPLIAIVRYAVIVLAVVIALGQAGIEMTSLLAVLGAAGLAIGLALQGTLTNIAAGIMLLWLRPFRVGDYIETAAVSGTVREIGLFVSHLETFDGLFVFAPNATLWNVWLRNHSRAASRTLSWTVTLPRDVSFAEVCAALLADWPSEEGGARAVTREVFLDELTETSQILVLNALVREGAIAGIQRGATATISHLLVARLGEAGAPKAIARLMPTAGDPSRFMSEAEAPDAGHALRSERPGTE